jgi:Zn-dependent protease with chaperone function
VEGVIEIATPEIVAIATGAIVDKIIKDPFSERKRVLFLYVKIIAMRAKFSTTEYRYPYEYIILGTTIITVFLVIAFTAAATICGSVLFVPLIVIVSYFYTRGKHHDLLSQGQQVTSQNAPELLPLIRTISTRLQVEPVNIFIVPSSSLNAYTFGMDSPKAIVLYSALFKIMDPDEIQFILGHEMGHVKLGHTWLNTLVGGMAGIPSSLSAATIMELAFRWWNRACEYSADRAGILACGKPNKAISALVKLEAGPLARSSTELQATMQHIETDDDDIIHNIEELLASHPMIAKRINEIRDYSNTQAYHRLRALMDQNLSL